MITPPSFFKKAYWTQLVLLIFLDTWPSTGVWSVYQELILKEINSFSPSTINCHSPKGGTLYSCPLSFLGFVWLELKTSYLIPGNDSPIRCCGQTKKSKKGLTYFYWSRLSVKSQSPPNCVLSPMILITIQSFVIIYNCWKHHMLE